MHSFRYLDVHDSHALHIAARQARAELIAAAIAALGRWFRGKRGAAAAADGGPSWAMAEQPRHR